MPVFVLVFLIGIVCSILGVAIRKGKLSLLHDYHTRRVTEEGRLPFGKQVGLGMLLIGAGMTTFGSLSTIALLADNPVLLRLSLALLAAGLVAGIACIIHALFKYNKGLF